jgi:hypothetical protein
MPQHKKTKAKQHLDNEAVEIFAVLMVAIFTALTVDDIHIAWKRIPTIIL